MTNLLQPRIAALETSGRAGSVTLALGPQAIATTELAANARHAAQLMPALELLCQAQGWLTSAPARPPLDQLYLSLGPGSFTGLRIAVAIARAMAQATGCLLVAVPSLDVIAENAPPEFANVAVILDAKRGQVFAACYQRSDTGDLCCVKNPEVVDPQAFLEEALAAAEGRGVAVLGEGVDYHRAALQRPGVHELPREFWRARAEVVHRLGWQKALRGEFADPRTLVPIYIRLPEAEEVWRKKHGSPAP